MFTQQLQAYLPRHVKAILSERLSVALTPSAAGSAGTLQVSYTISSLVLHLLVRRSHLLQDFRHILSSLLEVEPDALWLPLKYVACRMQWSFSRCGIFNCVVLCCVVM